MGVNHEVDDLDRAILSMDGESKFPNLAARISAEMPELGLLLFGNLFEQRGKLRERNGESQLAQEDKWTTRLLHTVEGHSHGVDGFYVIPAGRGNEQELEAAWGDLPPDAYQLFWTQANDPNTPTQVRAMQFQALWELRSRWSNLRFAKPMDVIDLSIKTHLEAARQISELEIDPMTKGMCLSRHWQTAVRLALSVGRLEHIRANLEYLRKVAADIMEDAPHSSLSLVDIELSASEFKGKRQIDLVSDERLNGILLELDKINSCLDTMNGMIHAQRDLVAIRGNAERLLGRPQDQKTSAERLARLHQQKAEAAGSGILANMYWKEAASQYLQAGLKEEGNRALAESREALRRAQANGEFQEVSVPIQLTEDKLRQMIDPYFAGATNTKQVLDRIARKLFAPSLEKGGASTAIPKSIVSQIALTMPVVNGRSLAALAPGSPEQQAFEEHQALQFEISIYSSILLCGIMSRLRETMSPTADEFVSHLETSPAVPEEEKSFYRLSFQHYLAGDNVSAMHILIPRIEQMVRWALRNSGAKATALRAEEIRERPLGELLREAETSNAFSEPVVRLLQAVLSEEWGMNLRNRVAHGFATANDFSQEKMERIVHIALLIARIATGTART